MMNLIFSHRDGVADSPCVTGAGSSFDIFKIQDEISAAIMSSLKVHLPGETEQQYVEAERTHNMEAYSAYLIGKERLALLGNERTRQWLNNGDSYSLLYMDPVIQEWSDRPEYQEFIDRNEAQVQRQQALYLAGGKARDEPEVAQDKATGY